MVHNIARFSILQTCQEISKKIGLGKIASNKIELLHQALYTFKESGDLDQALLNVHALPELDQTWEKAKEKFKKEYDDHRNNSNTESRQAGYGSAANST